MILQGMIPEGEAVGKTTKDRLVRQGFLFKYFTNTYENKKGNVYCYCYDYGYLALEGDWFLVVKYKDS